MNQQKEHQKEQLSLGDPFKTTNEISHYLRHWKNLLSDHTIELEELTEKLDNEASEELTELLLSLAQKAIEELKRVQCGMFVQELVKLNVPKLFLLEAVEEHKKEMVVKQAQLEREEHDKSMAAEELLQLTKQKLNQELETGISEQKKIRSWEQSIFMQVSLCTLFLVTMTNRTGSFHTYPVVIPNDQFSVGHLGIYFFSKHSAHTVPMWGALQWKSQQS